MRQKQRNNALCRLIIPVDGRHACALHGILRASPRLAVRIAAIRFSISSLKALRT
jgi:hypothetical protein